MKSIGTLVVERMEEEREGCWVAYGRRGDLAVNIDPEMEIAVGDEVRFEKDGGWARVLEVKRDDPIFGPMWPSDFVQVTPRVRWRTCGEPSAEGIGCLLARGHDGAHGGSMGEAFEVMQEHGDGEEGASEACAGCGASSSRVDVEGGLGMITLEEALAWCQETRATVEFRQDFWPRVRVWACGVAWDERDTLVEAVEANMETYARHCRRAGVLVDQRTGRLVEEGRDGGAGESGDPGPGQSDGRGPDPRDGDG